MHILTTKRNEVSYDLALLGVSFFLLVKTSNISGLCNLVEEIIKLQLYELFTPLWDFCCSLLVDKMSPVAVSSKVLKYWYQIYTYVFTIAPKIFKYNHDYGLKVMRKKSLADNKGLRLFSVGRWKHAIFWQIWFKAQVSALLWYIFTSNWRNVYTLFLKSHFGINCHWSFDNILYFVIFSQIVSFLKPQHYLPWTFL